MGQLMQFSQLPVCRLLSGAGLAVGDFEVKAEGMVAIVAGQEGRAAAEASIRTVAD